MLFVGTTMYTALLSVMNFKIAFMCRLWNREFTVLLVGSFLFYFITIFAYSAIQPEGSFYAIAPRMFGNITFFTFNILIPVTVYVLEVATIYIRDLFCPPLVNGVREREKLGMELDVNLSPKDAKQSLINKSSSASDYRSYSSTATSVQLSDRKSTRLDSAASYDTKNPLGDIPGGYSGFAFNAPEGELKNKNSTSGSSRKLT
jgi:hypothetical protein